MPAVQASLTKTSLQARQMAMRATRPLQTAITAPAQICPRSLWGLKSPSSMTRLWTCQPAPGLMQQGGLRGCYLGNASQQQVRIKLVYVGLWLSWQGSGRTLQYLGCHATCKMSACKAGKPRGMLANGLASMTSCCLLAAEPVTGKLVQRPGLHVKMQVLHPDCRYYCLQRGRAPCTAASWLQRWWECWAMHLSAMRPGQALLTAPHQASGD